MKMLIMMTMQITPTMKKSLMTMVCKTSMMKISIIMITHTMTISKDFKSQDVNTNDDVHDFNDRNDFKRRWMTMMM